VAEVNLQVDQVEAEHLRSVHQAAHWAYLILVPALGMLLMLLLIGWLGRSA
jgi:hypothetical protein